MTYSKLNPPTEEQVLAFHTELSNRGRWGADDELGTLNLITDEVRKRGAAAVRHGISVSCAWDIPTGEGGINRRTEVHTWPAGPERTFGGVNEHLTYDCHDVYFTHFDSIGHIFWDGKMYNDRVVEENVTVDGGVRFGAVTAAANGVLTRGVLLDIPAVRGVDSLDFGEAVYPEDLEEAEKRQNVRVEPGDAVLLRTGYDRVRHETGTLLSAQTGQAGWHAACLPWLRERDVAYIGADTGQDVTPSGYPTIAIPIHTVAHASIGLWMMDHCDFSECARTAERLQQWDFLLSVAPLRLSLGSGSAVNPIATF